MATDKVSSKIMADARTRVKELEAELAAAKQKLKVKQAECKKAYRAETVELTRIEEERIRREILAEARLAARREVLAAKHELITQTLQKAAQKFTKSKTYPALLARIVKEQGKGAAVLLSASDHKRFKNSAWAKKAQVAPIAGGVILRTKGQDLNFSLDAAFESLGEQLSLEIAELLFPDTGSAREPLKEK